MMKKDNVKSVVREAYGRIAKGRDKSCGCSDPKKFAKSIGYSEGEMATIPEGANLGLSCGNPTSLASLKELETIQWT